MKRKFLLPIIAALLVGKSINAFRSKDIAKVSAATPMPTNINMTNSTDAEVSNYYDGVNGKSGDALLGFLYTKIKNHNEYSYDNNTHRTIYKIIDRNWDLDAIDTVSPANTSNFNYAKDNGFIRKLYADYNDDINTADRFKNEGASRVSFDKEHIWAQSLGYFGRDGGAGSDFHALWPSDVKGNQDAHSNYSFGVPTTGIKDYTNDKGGYVGRNGYIAGYPNKVFEPLDQYKGDVARAMFYMPARYYEYIDAMHPKLELVNQSPDGHTASATVTGKAGVLETLLEWHELDPVDDYEIRRNNLIANNYQMNRNPFIDYPQWARIAYDPTYSGSGASNALETSSVGSEGGVSDAILESITLDTANVKTNYTVNETFTTNGLIVTGHFDDSSSKRINNFTTSIAEGTTLSTVGNHTITVSASQNGPTVSATYNITVNSAPVKELTSISISGAPETLKLKSTFDSSALSVTAHYHDGTTADVTSSSIIRKPNTDLLGPQLLRVDYSENAVTKSANYEVRVTNNGVDVGDAYSVATDLIFSEYVEGTSNNKYIEIFNGTGESVDLSDYQVLLFSNGSATVSRTLQLSGTLAHGDVIVLKNTGAALTLPEGVDPIADNTVITFNGNDALALKKVSTDEYVDVFGKIGHDPGTAWTGGGVTTVNKTLVRKPTVTSGVTTNPGTFDPSLEWIQYDIDTATYLGSHDMNLSTSNVTPLEQAEAFATFFLNATGPLCEEGEAFLLATDGTWALLSEEYGYMHIDTKLIFKNSALNAEGNDIEHTKARYLLLITRYSALHANNFLVDNNNTPIFGVKTNMLPPFTDNRHLAFIIIAFLGLTLIFPLVRKNFTKNNKYKH